MELIDIKTRLEELCAKDALRTLAFDYSHAADSRDAASITRLFHPDAVVDSGVIRAGPEEFANKFVRWLEDNTSVVSHTVCGSRFDVRGGEASGEVMVLALCQMNAANGNARILTVGLYRDKCIYYRGRWLYRERLFEPQVTWELPTASHGTTV